MSSLGEVNRLRKTHRPDIPLYEIPHVPRRKGKLTGVDKSVSPSTKKAKPNPISEKEVEDCVITHTDTPAATPLRFHSVQQSACQQLGLQHTAQPRLRPGGPMSSSHVRTCVVSDTCMEMVTACFGHSRTFLQGLRTSIWLYVMLPLSTVLSRPPSHRL